MLTCIACSKQIGGGSSLHDPEDEESNATPSTKQAIKALTAQVTKTCKKQLEKKDQLARVRDSSSSPSLQKRKQITQTKKKKKKCDARVASDCMRLDRKSGRV